MGKGVITILYSRCRLKVPSFLYQDSSCPHLDLGDGRGHEALCETR